MLPGVYAIQRPFFAPIILQSGKLKELGRANNVVYAGIYFFPVSPAYVITYRCAIKEIDLENGKKLPEFNNENNICYHLETMCRKYPDTIGAKNIVNYFGWGGFNLNSHYIIMERLNYSLHALIHDPKYYLGEQRLFEILRDIARGLSFIHGMNVVHCDIKPANILLDGNGRAKIGDFGLSYTGQTGVAVGTPVYSAPEVLEKKQGSRASDIYSFGMTMWETSERRIPFSEIKDNKDFFIAVCSGKRPPIDPGTPPRLAVAMMKAWNPDPKQRPSARKLLTFLKNPIYLRTAEQSANINNTDSEQYKKSPK